MSDPVIRVSNLSKKYVIGHQVSGDGLRHTLEEAIRSPRRWLRERAQARARKREEFWSLRDVNFEVRQGEVVGFIGRNGAGKSTLLKVLSRITEPTHGRVEIAGRVASLLEVGTGFHPELTGRENVFLNGAVLGMTHNEIKRKFDTIVAFSGVEKFLDTPVKRYSSGMYVRLAFSVAAHLDPEILIIDEVLAVGDAEFQKKCLGRMNDAAKEGRTVLFVTHNMATVQSLCTRAIFLRDGQVMKDGSVSDAIAAYSGSVHELISNAPLAERTDRSGGTELRVTSVEFFEASTGEPISTILSGQDVHIRINMSCRAGEPLDSVALAVAFFSAEGTYLFSCNSEAVGSLFKVDSGSGACVCRVRKWPLPSGRYTFNVFVARKDHVLDWIKEAGFVDVETGDFYGTGKNPDGAKKGVLIDYEWGSPSLASLARGITGAYQGSASPT